MVKSKGGEIQRHYFCAICVLFCDVKTKYMMRVLINFTYLSKPASIYRGQSSASYFNLFGLNNRLVY